MSDQREVTAIARASPFNGLHIPIPKCRVNRPPHLGSAKRPTPRGNPIPSPRFCGMVSPSLRVEATYGEFSRGIDGNQDASRSISSHGVLPVPTSIDDDGYSVVNRLLLDHVERTTTICTPEPFSVHDSTTSLLGDGGKLSGVTQFPPPDPAGELICFIPAVPSLVWSWPGWDSPDITPRA